MSKYLTWKEKIITDFSDENINALYSEGYLFTRLGKGVMHQTRSIRIDLSQFELSSENRRILKKTSDLGLQTSSLPLKNYNWQIGKLAKDFYEAKFGKGIFSANKIKEILTDPNKSNFNTLLQYVILSACLPARQEAKDPLNDGPIGYCIARETDKLLHYSYPFYLLSPISHHSDTGLGMMLNAILYAQEHSKKYIYLGSAQRPTDTYKLQFRGLEWWDGKEWQMDLKKLKDTIQPI